MNNYDIGPNGLALIKEFEGLALSAYYCPANVLTIGYGHTGKDVYEGMQISEQHAEQLLKKDLAKFVDGVNSLINVECTQNQFDALVCFAYNLGLSCLASSSLLKKFNAGDTTGAANVFLLYVKARNSKGELVTLPGLERRRKAEKALFEA